MFMKVFSSILTFIVVMVFISCEKSDDIISNEKPTNPIVYFKPDTIIAFECIQPPPEEIITSNIFDYDTVTNFNLFELDIDGDNIKDFKFRSKHIFHWDVSDTHYLLLESLRDSAKIIIDKNASYFEQDLDSSQIISYQLGLEEIVVLQQEGFSIFNEAFTDKGVAYMGFVINNHYGWIRFKFDRENHRTELVEWAINFDEYGEFFVSQKE